MFKDGVMHYSKSVIDVVMRKDVKAINMTGVQFLVKANEYLYKRLEISSLPFLAKQMNTFV